MGAVQRVLTLLLVGWDREWDMLKVESLRDRKAVHQRLLVAVGRESMSVVWSGKVRSPFVP